MIWICGCTAFNYRVADDYYEQYAYSKAIPKYEKVLRKDFYPDAAAKLANSYAKTGNSLKAEIWYKRLVKSPMVSVDDKLHLGEVLMENGKYDEAAIWFKEYLALNAGDKRVKRLLQACDSIEKFFEDTTLYHCFLLPFNQEFTTSFSPVFFKKGLVFLSDRNYPGKKSVISSWTGREYLDLFYTFPTGANTWQLPEPLSGDINGDYDEGPATFSPDGTEIYFTRSDYEGKHVAKNEMDYSLLKMYKGNYVQGRWKLEAPVIFNNRDYSVGHPALSSDGKTMYFVSDMPWGYGGTDIYRSVWSNGAWSDPENLGPNVNSDGNEMFPFISYDNTLYFASDGHPGLGGLDVYASYFERGKWSKAENLQYPVNSSKDDFGFIIDSTNATGYFSSNRQKNTDKIFGFTKNPPVFSLLLYVSDFKTRKPVKTFRLIDNSVASKPVLANGTSGEADMELKKNTDYDLYIKAPGYYATPFRESTVGMRKSQVLIDSVAVRKIEMNKAEIWRDIQFGKKNATLNGTSYAALDSLAKILIMNPELQVEVSAHTDSRGNSTENLNISRERADEVVFYLIDKGVQANRLISTGYGESRLLNNCRDGILCLEEDHQVNNRIEIKVVELLK